LARAQIIGASNSTQGFTLVRPIDGIRMSPVGASPEFDSTYQYNCLVGLGPSGSNAGDVSGLNATPTFVETLVLDGSIDKPVFGVFISPLGQNGVPEGTGEISFGGVDESRIQGD
jgi:Eukaryotic aspartyl protease